MGRRSKYSAEFKEQAIQLGKELNCVSEAARQLGIYESQIRKWTKDLEEEIDIKKDDPSFTIEEFKRIKSENNNLKKANQILKMATAFFSQDHLK